MARNEVHEAQMFAIKCCSKFSEEVAKPFKEILTGEIAQKTREMQNAD